MKTIVTYEDYKYKLHGEYNEVFKKIEAYLYLNGGHLFSEEENTILSDILSLLLEAQDHNKPISLVIGNNIEDFCDMYIQENKSISKKERIEKSFEFIIGVCAVISILMLLYEVGMIMYHALLNNQNILFENTSIPVDFFIFMAIYGILVDYFVIAKLVYKFKNISKENLVTINWMSGYFIANWIKNWIGLDFHITLPRVAFIFMYTIGSLLGFLLLKKGIAKGKTKNIPLEIIERTVNEISYTSLVKKHIQKYHTKNGKRRKQGLLEVTKHEYSQKLITKIKRTVVVGIFILIGTILIVRTILYGVYMTSTITDFYIFTGIIGVLCLLFGISAYRGYRNDLQLLKALQQENANIFNILDNETKQKN